ncbi:MAG: DUF1840 domain-containing protein [Caldimonas sp.]
MIYKFKSKAAGDLIMMGPAGDAVLRIIGREPAAHGIIEAAALPAAIAAIEQAVAADEGGRKGADTDPVDEAGGAGGRVSLRQRVWPLLETMRRSQREGADIVWGV